MDLYFPYKKLTGAQRKLLCFMAFIGAKTNRSTIRAYAENENIPEKTVLTTIRSLHPLFSSYHIYDLEYSLKDQHRFLLLVYLIEEKQEWLSQFRDDYHKHQDKKVRTALKVLNGCVEGVQILINFIESDHDMASLVPLVNDERFHPIIEHVPSYYFDQFATSAIIYQLENDLPDPENLVGKLAESRYPMLPKDRSIELQANIALYDFFKQGRYDEKAAKTNTITGKMLAAFHSLYAGNYDEAFSFITAAMRIHNRNIASSEKGFFYQVINNYLTVMIYQLLQSEEGMKKLNALSSKRHFTENTLQQSATSLVKYFTKGEEPRIGDIINSFSDAFSRDNLHACYLMELVCNYLDINGKTPTKMPEIPQMHILRHELSPWLPLSEEEKERLCNEFGGTPLLRRIHHKSKWEILLEELTPRQEDDSKAVVQQTSRVAYIVNYDWVEPREQQRKKNGEWGAGKRMSMETFHRVTSFMDETDRTISKKTSHSFYRDLSIYDTLPYLVGSNRVYTGSYAPFTPVTVVEEKPYLIIEKTSKAFLVKSNIRYDELSRNPIVKRDDEAHYTVIRLSEQQRTYYEKLLEIKTFPLEAEGQLRVFLPKISDIVEVHSDLVEGGSTLEQREGQARLCIQVLPSAGMRNVFMVYCHAKPLADCINNFVPGKGINPCVAEENGVRYQVNRDIRGERNNAKILENFMDDNDFGDTVNDEKPAQVNAEELLRLLGFVQENADKFMLEWPKGEVMRLKTSQVSNWNIQLKSQNGWFEVEGEIPIDDETVLTAQQFLELVAESPKSGFIRLNDTDFISISDKLRKQLSRIESLTVNDHGHLRISEFHASLLGSALNGEISVKHDKKIEELQEKIKSSMATEPKVPKKLKAELRDYQMDGYQWMERITGWGAGVCLADDMGLGKTVQTISFLLDKMKEGPALVAAPASVVPNWRNELARFSPALNVEVLNTADDRKKIVEKAKAGDVIITTYGLFVTEDESLIKKKWTTICLDEAHVIKNRETKTSSVAMKLEAKYRLILTGTPMQNHLGELWNLFQFINPGLLGSYEQFTKKYIIPIEQQDNQERSRQLRRLIAPFMLRRTKQEVVEELPDKTEINLPVELSEDEMAVYEVIRRRAKQMLEDEASDHVSMNTLAEITKLRQAACAAQLVEKSWNNDCSKVKLLTELVEDIVGGGNAVLIFSQFTSFLDIVKKAFDAAKLSYLYLDGSVGMRKREQLVSQFQKGECPIFIISLKAGGLGLNLTGANYVVHLDPWWNPAIEQQATDRAYRIGQRQSVTVYHLISQHTIEEKILRLHDTKRNLADAMLEGSNQSHKLTAKDLLEMLG